MESTLDDQAVVLGANTLQGVWGGHEGGARLD